MANFTNIPFITPIKWLVNGVSGIHSDQDFAVNLIKPFETPWCYKQKWQYGDQTPIQITSTVAPSPVQVYTGAGKLITGIDFPWTLVGTGAALGVSLWETTINLDALSNAGYYHLYFEANLLSYSAKFVSEKIDLRVTHKNTMMFSYKNSLNDFGVYWSTGITMNYRCEAGLLDYQPESEGADFIDQIHDVKILSATPYDTFKLYIGEAPGVANFVIKTLNYIFACDQVRLRRDLNDKGMLFTKAIGEKWDATRVKAFPQFGWSTTVSPSLNVSSLQFNDEGNPLTPGIVTAYDIDTNLFSTEHVEIAHILDITTQ